MSAATELPPVVHIPERAREASSWNPGRPRAGSPHLRLVMFVDTEPGSGERPSPAVVDADRSVGGRDLQPLSLTRRGRALAVAVAVLASAAVLWIGHGSAASDPGPVQPVPATVQIRDGDTLWGIATRVAPRDDPRTVVARLRDLNHLATLDLMPGTTLRLR